MSPFSLSNFLCRQHGFKQRIMTKNKIQSMTKLAFYCRRLNVSVRKRCRCFKMQSLKFDVDKISNKTTILYHTNPFNFNALNRLFPSLWGKTCQTSQSNFHQ